MVDKAHAHRTPRELQENPRESHVGWQASQLVLSAVRKQWRWVSWGQVTEASALRSAARLWLAGECLQFLSHPVSLIPLLGMPGID